MSEGAKRPACRPHAWKVPEAGDDDLICLKCGRCMGLLEETSEIIRESIFGARVRHYGTEPGEEFRQAFNVAYLDALDRCRNAGRGAVSVEVERREPELTKDLRLRIFNFVRFGMKPERVGDRVGVSLETVEGVLGPYKDRGDLIQDGDKWREPESEQTRARRERLERRERPGSWWTKLLRKEGNHE